MTAPAAWPFPRWIFRDGRWQMVKARLPKTDPIADAERNLL